ncbi:hypothetical protein [Pseudomonas sp. MPR-ANC1]|uniref:hypothetical protein n=1 Tax=Pseudomonas sp. MPR-ANC1 TaxID=2075548 RepID=UPI001304DAC2|nr:hypothetical protein [Pseudomonas sp. MPR-ANC1]
MKILGSVGLLIAIIGLFGGSLAIILVALAAVKYKTLMAALILTCALLWRVVGDQRTAF